LIWSFIYRTDYYDQYYCKFSEITVISRIVTTNKWPELPSGPQTVYEILQAVATKKWIFKRVLMV